MIDTITAKSVPLVKKLFPSYRKKNVFLTAATGVNLTDLNWSGGSRSEYTVVDLDTGVMSGVGDHMAAPWDNADENRRVNITPRQIIVKTGMFCGKPSTMSITVHPDTKNEIVG